MNWLQAFQHVESLEDSRYYFLRLPPRDHPIPLFVQVRFIGYTSCPAVVVVQDARRYRFPCERAALFTYNQSTPQDSVKAMRTKGSPFLVQPPETGK